MLEENKAITVEPKHSGPLEIDECFANSEACAEQFGGEVVSGWSPAMRPFKRRQSPFRIWMNHAVWKDTDGNLWNVTPSVLYDNELRECKFIIDPTAYPKGEKGKRRVFPCQHFPDIKEPWAAQWCKCADRNGKAVYDGDKNGEKYWRHKCDAIAYRQGFSMNVGGGAKQW